MGWSPPKKITVVVSLLLLLLGLVLGLAGTGLLQLDLGIDANVMVILAIFVEAIAWALLMAGVLVRGL
jgi:hypothetical protein